MKELNKKWKNLRQCYKRERDSQHPKSGSAKKKKTQYVYFDVLSFLAPIFNTKTTASNVADGEEEDEEEEGEKEVEDPSQLQVVGGDEANQSAAVKSSTAKKSSSRKRGTENTVAEVCQVLKKSLEERMAAEKRQEEKDEGDDDKQFMMSLLSYTRAVQGIHKLNMRSELLQVVTKYYDMSMHPQSHFSQPFQTSFQQPLHTRFARPQFSQPPNASFPALSPTSSFSAPPSPNVQVYQNESSYQSSPQSISHDHHFAPSQTLSQINRFTPSVSSPQTPSPQVNQSMNLSQFNIQ